MMYVYVHRCQIVIHVRHRSAEICKSGSRRFCVVRHGAVMPYDDDSFVSRWSKSGMIGMYDFVQAGPGYWS